MLSVVSVTWSDMVAWHGSYTDLTLDSTLDCRLRLEGTDCRLDFYKAAHTPPPTLLAPLLPRLGEAVAEAFINSHFYLLI